MIATSTLTRTNRPWLVKLMLTFLWIGWGLAAPVAGDEIPPALTPEESKKEFTVAEGLEIDLVVAEPEISQPLSISFDDRGRMWVLQYLQYPNPNGLKAVEMDNWLRTKYDRVPEPPPEGPKGRDRISIYEDTDGDGRSDKVTHFITDLNLASGMALGHGGVFVAQPPYLLYYADKDENDVPDGPPEVLLKGFGMEDAHAFANSLTWGPDGWLYGAQGSTATADIRGIGFQQGVWRYHPLTREFELFAEGGGNTWGIDFDRFGNLFAGGNTVEPLVHHVQGAYYVKGFGKHGPLHNPHTYGYFQPVKHIGYLGDSLTGGFVLYQGGAFPKHFDNACIAPNTRHSASRWSTLEVHGSTFVTRAAGDFITSTDIWFRPIESTVGPDGALYVADWYDYNISHSSPKNRSEWYQPSRFDGRVWRVAPRDVKLIASGSFDLSKRTSAELVKLLTHPNDWYARQARRILAERRDGSICPQLLDLLHSSDQRTALQGLWSLYVTGVWDDELAQQCFESPHEYVRAWAVRLLGDARKVSPAIATKLSGLAEGDPSVVVRSQLACTAKRLDAQAAVPIIDRLLMHDEDVQDVHIPLLIWWAIENKAIRDTELVLRLVQDPSSWQRKLMRQFIIERLARRFAAEGTDAGFVAFGQLLDRAPDTDSVSLIVRGLSQALAGQKFDAVPSSLEPSLHRLLKTRPDDLKVLEIALRMGDSQADVRAREVIGNPSIAVPDRVALIQAVGESGRVRCIDALLQFVEGAKEPEVTSAALRALGYFEEPRVAKVVLTAFPGLPANIRATAIDLLCSRREWAMELLGAVDAKAIAPTEVPVPLLQQLVQHQDEQIDAKIAKIWGKVQPATDLQKQGRMTALMQMLHKGKGSADRGKPVFEKNCGICHKLHGQGQNIGPDLSGAERKDLEKLLRNIVDPSAVVREEFISHVAVTVDGRILTGLLAESKEETITLLDAKNQRTVIQRADLESLRESPTSLMPEKILEPLSDQEIRDLIAYLQSDN